MITILRTIIAICIAISLQAGMSDATEVSPRQAAADCMEGLVTMQEETMDRYAGNTWISFLNNLKGDEDTVQRMRDAIFRNLSYQIEEVEERNDAAVAKVTITQCDFSGVLKKYDRKSYKYITDHLYDEDITDRKQLNARCLDIYVSQIEKVAKAGKTREQIIYLPMHSNGYNGWNVELTEEAMQAIVGDLAVPGLK